MVTPRARATLGNDLVLGLAVDAKLRIAARALIDAPALHQLALDVVLGWIVVGGPHLVPLVAVAMEQADLINREHVRILSLGEGEFRIERTTLLRRGWHINVPAPFAHTLPHGRDDLGSEYLELGHGIGPRPG